MLIAYATEEGDMATDRGAGLGLFASHLANTLSEPGLELRKVFQRVRAAVYAASEGDQRPASYDNMIGEFYFFPPEEWAANVTAERRVVDSDPVAALRESAAERWEEIEGTERLDELQGFIEKYRDEPGADVLVTLAGSRVQRLEAEGKQLRLEREARTVWGLVRDAESAEALERFVTVYGRVAGVAELVRQAEERLAALRGPQVWTNSLGMEFVLIPAGEFLMGSAGELADDDEQPETRVRISEAFYLGKFEVTQGQWEAVMGSNPSYLANCGLDCPVESVTWDEVQEFVRKLNAREGADRYRLPTEAEWEYAARAGSRTDTPAGDLRILGKSNAPKLDAIAWYGGNSGVRYEGGYYCSGWDEEQYSTDRCGPHPVGRKAANGLGLHDMLGNVWEWVADWHGDYPGGAVTDPKGPSTGSYRVKRGGGWNGGARNCRAANRDWFAPGKRNFYLGFRLLRTH